MFLRGLVVVVAVVESSCAGLLFLEQAQPCAQHVDCPQGLFCVGGFCIKPPPGDCSPTNPAGGCPAGKVCESGVCITDVRFCCDCALTQGCKDCVCTDCTVANQCSQSNLTGCCNNGEVCVSGSCQPAECGVSGTGCFCESGMACEGGRCVLIDDQPCDAGTGVGRCDAGKTCIAGPGCAQVPCEALYPCGFCDPDYVCRNAVCEQLPCSPDHKLGYCAASGEKCSVAAGVCIPSATCLGDGDCTTGFCSFCGGSPGVCRSSVRCDCEGDCPAASDYCSAFIPRRCIADNTCAGDIDCAAGTEFCCATNICVDPLICCAAADCGPGKDCQGGACVNTGAVCTTNDSVPCSSPGQLYCCPAGELCCNPGEICGVDVGSGRHCLPHGACGAGGDCLAPLTCQSGFCEPVGAPCTGSCAGGCQGSCAATEICSAEGACIPNNQCAAKADCNPIEFCTGTYECQVYCGCGCEPSTSEVVPPNMLVVLDRSGSMNSAVGACQRWKTAIEAIALVTYDHESKIRFGLNVFPGTSSGSCLPGDTTCTGCANCYPGTVQVAIGDTVTTRPLITNFLCGDTCANGDCPGDCTTACPGGTGTTGFTPTGPTLIHLRNNPGSAGLNDTTRPNYIMLLTDGDANCDNDAYSAASPDTNSDVECSTTGDADTQARLNHYLRGLAALTPPVQTFVVGFAFGGVSVNLNCNAVNGGRSRCGDDISCAQYTAQGLCQSAGCSAHGNQAACDAVPNCRWNTSPTPDRCDARSGGCFWDTTPNPDVCVGVTAANCASLNATAGACYYPADSATELSSTFDAIAGLIASCTYTVLPEPTDMGLVVAYLDYGTNPLPGSCNGQNPCPVDPGPTTWSRDSIAKTIVFHDPMCRDIVQAGVASPVIVVGCCTPGEGC